MQTKPRNLLEAIRDAIRIKHYSYPTEKSYTNRIKRFILAQYQIVVRNLKGMKGRVVMRLNSLVVPLQKYLQNFKRF